MYDLDRTSWEILNATADDWENLEQIYQMVCFDFSSENYANREQGAYYLRHVRESLLLEEIADRIHRLMEAGLLEGWWGESGKTISDLKDLSYVWRGWFRMTPQGRSLWDASAFSAEWDQAQQASL